MNRIMTGVDTATTDYINSLLPAEPPPATALREATATLAGAGMQISREQAQFMQLLLLAIGARNTIEVGVFTGYSTMITAAVLPADGKVIACDVSREWTDVGRPHWQAAGVAARIDLRLAPAVDTLDALLAEGRAGDFDFAFIDADKTNYGAYYERCIQLVRSGGLILIDNALWDGRSAQPANREPDTVAIRELSALISQDTRVHAYLAACGDGLHIARKK